MNEHPTLLKMLSENGLHDENYIREQFDIIKEILDVEITAKQKTIAWQEQEVQRLHVLVEEKNSLLFQNKEKLAESMRASEGNRQLINKLLNDIDRLNQDIQWYRRTYETRSFWGTVKQKLFNLTGK